MAKPLTGIPQEHKVVTFDKFGPNFEMTMGVTITQDPAKRLANIFKLIYGEDNKNVLYLNYDKQADEFKLGGRGFTSVGKYATPNNHFSHQFKYSNGVLEWYVDGNFIMKKEFEPKVYDDVSLVFGLNSEQSVITGEIHYCTIVADNGEDQIQDQEGIRNIQNIIIDRETCE